MCVLSNLIQGVVQVKNLAKRSREDLGVRNKTAEAMTFIAFIFDSVFAVCLWGFAAVHVYFAMTNRTSIENGYNSRRYRLSTQVTKGLCCCSCS